MKRSRHTGTDTSDRRIPRRDIRPRSPTRRSASPAYVFKDDFETNPLLRFERSFSRQPCERKTLEADADAAHRERRGSSLRPDSKDLKLLMMRSVVERAKKRLQNPIPSSPRGESQTHDQAEELSVESLDRFDSTTSRQQNDSRSLSRVNPALTKRLVSTTDEHRLFGDPTTAKVPQGAVNIAPSNRNNNSPQLYLPPRTTQHTRAMKKPYSGRVPVNTMDNRDHGLHRSSHAPNYLHTQKTVGRNVRPSNSSLDWPGDTLDRMATRSPKRQKTFHQNSSGLRHDSSTVDLTSNSDGRHTPTVGHGKREKYILDQRKTTTSTNRHNSFRGLVSSGQEYRNVEHRMMSRRKSRDALNVLQGSSGDVEQEQGRGGSTGLAHARVSRVILEAGHGRRKSQDGSICDTLRNSLDQPSTNDSQDDRGIHKTVSKEPNFELYLADPQTGKNLEAAGLASSCWPSSKRHKSPSIGEPDNSLLRQRLRGKMANGARANGVEDDDSADDDVDELHGNGHTVSRHFTAKRPQQNRVHEDIVDGNTAIEIYEDELNCTAPASPNHSTPAIVSDGAQRPLKKASKESSRKRRASDYLLLESLSCTELKVPEGPLALQWDRVARAYVLHTVVNGDPQPPGVGYIDVQKAGKMVHDGDEGRGVRLTGPIIEGIQFLCNLVFQYQNGCIAFKQIMMEQVSGLKEVKKSGESFARILSIPMELRSPKATSERRAVTNTDDDELALLQKRTGNTTSSRPSKRSRLRAAEAPAHSPFDKFRAGNELLADLSWNARSTRASKRLAEKPPHTQRNRSPSPPVKFSIATGLGTPWMLPVKFPFPGRSKITVLFDDLLCLDEQEYLNDNVIDFYLNFAQDRATKAQQIRQDTVYLFNSFFYLTMTKGGSSKIDYDAVARWTTKAKVDIFGYDFVVIPIIEEHHWYLAIICNLSRIRRECNAALDDEGPSETGIDGVDGLQRDVKLTRQMDERKDAEGMPSNLADLSHQTANLRIGHGAEFHEASVVDAAGDWPDDAENPVRASTSPFRLSSKDKMDSAEETLRKLTNGALLSTLPSSPAPKKSNRRRSGPQGKIDPNEPSIIIMDSMGMAHTSTIRNLKAYITEEAKAKRGMDIAITKATNAKQLPQQDNVYDCGVYVLAYFEKFIGNPHEFARKILQKEMDPVGDWPDMNPSTLRKTLREILQDMYREQARHRQNEKEEKEMQEKQEKQDKQDRAQANQGQKLSESDKTPEKTAILGSKNGKEAVTALPEVGIGIPTESALIAVEATEGNRFTLEQSAQSDETAIHPVGNKQHNNDSKEKPIPADSLVLPEDIGGGAAILSSPPLPRATSPEVIIAKRRQTPEQSSQTLAPLESSPTAEITLFDEVHTQDPPADTSMMMKDWTDELEVPDSQPGTPEPSNERLEGPLEYENHDAIAKLRAARETSPQQQSLHVQATRARTQRSSSAASEVIRAKSEAEGSRNRNKKLQAGQLEPGSEPAHAIAIDDD